MNRLLSRHLLLLALTLLAAALQFVALDAQSLWYDEGFSVWLSQKPLAEIVSLTAADIQPPLYYLLLHGWMTLTGQSEWTLRVLSAFFAVLAVPLMWQVAWRLLRQRTAAGTAALLVTFSPLWLWYGREVRNYALGLALILAAAWYLLALLPERPPPRPSSMVAFVLLLTAGLYTHYFILFVYLAWAGTVAVALWHQPRRAALLPIATALFVPLLLYLPWAGVIVQRLGSDRSYWEGTLSVREVVESAVASWMTGHSVHEATATPIGYVGAILAVAGLLLAVYRAQRGLPTRSNERPDAPLRLPPHHVLFTFLWLVMPVLGLLAIAWNRPKYNPRYLIFAAPAFLLCLSALVGWLWGRKGAGRAVAASLTVGLLAFSLMADWNLYRDPAFAKSDWRAVAVYLREMRQPGEAIVLVSGHAFPVFQYYLPDDALPLIRLPDERTLDTTAVLGLEAVQTLAPRLRGATGVWLVNWQDEVADPDGVVPAILQAAGATREQSPSFMDLRLTHWQLPAAARLDEALRPAHPLQLRFGEALHLLGWSTLPSPPPADEGLSLVLYWAAQRPLAEDYKVRLTVVDGAGFEYGVLDQRPTSYLFPTFRWSAGEPRLATIEVPLEPGTPPGEYWVQLSVYPEGGPNLDLLDAAGAPQGQQVRLGPFEVAPPMAGWLGVGPPANVTPLNETLLDNQQLLAARMTLPAQLERGQRLPLTLWWRTGGALPGATLHLGWERGGSLLSSDQRAVAGAGWPGEQWRPSDLLMTPLLVRVPRDIEPGSVRLVAWLTDRRGRESRHVTLTTGEVVAGARSFDLPAVGNRQQATFGATIRLLGYDMLPASDGTMRLTLHWEAIGESDASLTTFAHLLDSDGALVPDAGQDKVPLDGRRPTDSWLTGEFLSDTFTLRPPEGEALGSYTVEIGWYDASDPAFPRLPARGEGADGTRVLLRECVMGDEGCLPSGDNP